MNYPINAIISPGLSQCLTIFFKRERKVSQGSYIPSGVHQLLRIRNTIESVFLISLKPSDHFSSSFFLFSTEFRTLSHFPFKMVVMKIPEKDVASLNYIINIG